MEICRRPRKTRAAKIFWSRKALPSELDLSGGITVVDEYAAGDNLKTALSDLDSFLTDAKLPKNGSAKLTLKRGKVSGYESYRIEVGKSGITITADDDEGLRRGVYFLQDLIQSQDGAFLPVGKIERKPWIKNRISRCFFGPIKRPHSTATNYLDDIDYYPDEYLSKLAREGINGLWLTIEFRELAKTSFTERDPNAEKRLEKLRKTVEKCGRYGIKVWLFAIEPKSLPADDPLLAAHPEWKGARGRERLRFLHRKRIGAAILAGVSRRHFRKRPKSGRAYKYQPRRKNHQLSKRASGRL